MTAEHRAEAEVDGDLARGKSAVRLAWMRAWRLGAALASPGGQADGQSRPGRADRTAEAG